MRRVSRLTVAFFTLGSLGAGDYAIEVILLATPEERIVTGLRVTR
jgi:hypothetical protein